MKKIIISLALSFFVVVGSYSQNIDKFISELAQEQEADNVKIGGFLFALAKPFMASNVDDKEAWTVCNGIKAIQVVDVSNCDEKKRSAYLSKLNQIKDKGGYETVIRVKDKGEDIRIIMKSKVNKKDKIEGLYILSIDESNISAVKLEGNIKRKDIEKLTAKYDK